MLMLRKNRRTQGEGLEHATRSDFQQIFTEDMAGLHLLALLLTADPGKAEACFVAGLESARGNAVFRHWARSWSKRAIVKNAIQALQPAPGNLRRSYDAANARNAGDGPGMERTDLITAITRLDDFPRFVLVMTVLEGYSLRECAALLACPAQEAARARSLALQHLPAQPSGAQADEDDAAVSWRAVLASAQAV